LIIAGNNVKLIKALKEAAVKDRNGKRSDDDILRCRTDILRARDIIPSETPPSKEPVCLPTETAGKKEAVKTAQQQTNVPKFNLAEEIMAEQRRITAIKRKGPDKKIELEEPQIQAVRYAIEQPGQTLAEQDQIIAEIVARDIERFCSGEYSVNSE
jgi:hypothetical protein